MADDREYEVGYGKPPKATRFKKGQSGNPKGRPKGCLNVATIVERTMSQKVQVKENGRTRTCTKLEVAITQLANKAAGGDFKALREANSYIREADEVQEKEAQKMGRKQKVRLVDPTVLKQLANRVTLLSRLNDKATGVIMRVHFQTSWFESGRVHLPRQAPWLADYRRELLAFPQIKHDDQVDSTTQAMEWAGQPQERYGIVMDNSPERIARHQAMKSFMGALGASGRSRGW